MGGVTSSRLRPAPAVLRRVAAYLAVGVGSFGADFGLLLLLREGFGTPVWVAGTVGFWVSVAVNYGLNRVIAFGDRAATRASLFRYAVLLGINWLVTLGVLNLAGVVGVGYLFGKVTAVALLMVLNYVAYARWVFPAVTEA